MSNAKEVWGGEAFLRFFTVTISVESYRIVGQEHFIRQNFRFLAGLASKCCKATHFNVKNEHVIKTIAMKNDTIDVNVPEI